MQHRHETQETNASPAVELAAAGDTAARLDAGLAADQAERARLEAKWTAKMRRFDAAQNLFSRGLQNWFWNLLKAFGASLLFWAVTLPFGESSEALAIARYAVPLLIGFLMVAWLGVSALGNWVLDLLFPQILKAARAEGVDVHGPAVKQKR